MPKLILRPIRKQAWLSICLPLGSVIAVSLAALFFSPIVGRSMLLGGVIWFLPQAVVVLKLFQSIETTPRCFVMLFYKSEVIKLISMGGLCIVIIKWIPASFIGLFAGYLCAQVIFWMIFLVDKEYF